MRASTIMRPSGCSTPCPCTMRSVKGVAALPMSIWLHRMLSSRASSAVCLGGPGPGLLGGPFELVGAPAGQHDRITVAGKRKRDRFADAGAGTGDEGNFVRRSH